MEGKISKLKEKKLYVLLTVIYRGRGVLLLYTQGNFAPIIIRSKLVMNIPVNWTHFQKEFLQGYRSYLRQNSSREVLIYKDTDFPFEPVGFYRKFLSQWMKPETGVPLRGQTILYWGRVIGWILAMMPHAKNNRRISVRENRASRRPKMRAFPRILRTIATLSYRGV